MGDVVALGVFENRRELFVGAGDPIGGLHCCQEAFAEGGLFSSAGGAVPRHGRFECRVRGCELSD